VPEDIYIKAPGPADKAAVRCFVCDCCGVTQGVLFLRVITEDEGDVAYISIPLKHDSLDMIAFDLQSEMQFPKPGLDGTCSLVNPPWWKGD
jgi:hypothetical protein